MNQYESDGESHLTQRPSENPAERLRRRDRARPDPPAV